MSNTTFENLESPKAVWEYSDRQMFRDIKDKACIQISSGMPVGFWVERTVSKTTQEMLEKECPVLKVVGKLISFKDRPEKEEDNFQLIDMLKSQKEAWDQILHSPTALWKRAEENLINHIGKQAILALHEGVPTKFDIPYRIPVRLNKRINDTFGGLSFIVYSDRTQFTFLERPIEEIIKPQEEINIKNAETLFNEKMDAGILVELLKLKDKIDLSTGQVVGQIKYDTISQKNKDRLKKFNCIIESNNLGYNIILKWRPEHL